MAMCSVRISRSAPATSIFSRLSARITASKKGPRWRTRMSTSRGRVPRGGPGFHRARDLGRELDRGAGFAGGVERRVPAFFAGVLLVGRDQVPDFHLARGVRVDGLMHRLDRVVAQAAEGLCGGANTVSTALQHSAGRSGRNSPASRPRIPFRCPRRAPRKCWRISAKASGAAPWNEKIDCFSSPTAKIVRLIFSRAPPPANSETSVLMMSHCFGARVLRLVDQHVIDAEIELVEHPGRRGVAEQRQRLVDQVVVIEQPAPVFFGAIALDHRMGDGDERGAAVTRAQGEFARDEIADAILFGSKRVAQSRIRLGEVLRSGCFCARSSLPVQKTADR